MRLPQITLIISLIILIGACNKQVEVEPKNLYGTWEHETTDKIKGMRFNENGTFEYLAKDGKEFKRDEDYKKYQRITFSVDYSENKVFLNAYDSTNTPKYLMNFTILELSKSRLKIQTPFWSQTWVRVD